MKALDAHSLKLTVNGLNARETSLDQAISALPLKPDHDIEVKPVFEWSEIAVFPLAAYGLTLSWLG